jgi:tetratricopeptide (TPR) repeat protein
MFEKVARAEPHFRAAWAQLLLAESSHAVSTLLTTGSDAPIRRSLQGHIAEARSRHGTFAEVLIVEMELLPLDAFAERIRLAEAAVALDPENPNARFARGDELMSVGRVSDAIADVNRAHLLDPLSPAGATSTSTS